MGGPLLPTPPPSSRLRRNNDRFLQSQNFPPVISCASGQLTGGFSTPLNSHFRGPSRSRGPHRIPADVFHVTRAHFSLIKCLHHASCLSKRTPQTLERNAHLLTSLLRPALPSEAFRRRAARVADTWLTLALEALSEHYSEVKEAALDAMRSNPLPHNLLETSIALAKKWASRQLGRKLTSDTVSSAVSEIRRCQAILPPHLPAALTAAPRMTPPRATPRSTPPQAVFRTVPPRVSPRVSPRVTPRVSPRVSPRVALPASVSLPTQATSLLAEILPTQQAPSVSRSVPVTDPAAASSATSEDTLSTPLPQRPPRGRKRFRSSPPAVRQLDLHGNTVPSSGSSAHAWEENVVLGDGNYRGLTFPATTVLAHNNGRLSHLKTVLNSLSAPQPKVQRVAIGLSSLDKDNALISNTTALKAVLGAARRVFPNAKLLVQLAGIDTSFSAAQRENLQALNAFVLHKKPSSCVHVPTATNFKLVNGGWDPHTQTDISSSLAAFLA